MTLARAVAQRGYAFSAVGVAHRGYLAGSRLVAVLVFPQIDDRTVVVLLLSDGTVRVAC